MKQQKQRQRQPDHDIAQRRGGSGQVATKPKPRRRYGQARVVTKAEPNQVANKDQGRREEATPVRIEGVEAPASVRVRLARSA
jgi:hypothetical protein